MAGHSEHHLPDEAIEHRLLSSIWRRLDEAERLATGASAMKSLILIAAMAEEVAVLARALELVGDTNTPA